MTGSNYFGNAGQFLVDTLFSLYILTFMLRFLFQWARADFYNPVSQFLVKVTNPLLVPVRRLIPGLFGLDMAALLIMFLLSYLKLVLLNMMMPLPFTFFPVMIAVVAIAELIKQAIYIFMFTIIVQAIMSWINPHSYNPVTSLLYSLNQPLLRPAQRLLPDLGGLDLSPLLVLIVLQLLLMLVVAPLFGFASGLQM